jgi:hypothetical protein
VAALDQAIEQAIAQGRMPGAVLVVGHDGKVVYRKAYGHRALVPHPEDMTADTIFDCASLTKVIATTSSLMKLFEQGKFRLNDKITDYIPEFQGGKSDITIRNLFTHFSGLQPDVPLKDPWTGYDTGIKLACTFKPGGPPATRYVYSDINFILLGEIVRKLSGKLDRAHVQSRSVEGKSIDYIEGWYEGNAERMERALHPELAKRIVRTNQDGRSRLDQMGAMTLVQGTKRGGGKDTPKDKQQKDVTILDVFENAASVKVVASDWIDYLHVAKFNGRWVIVNVLWELKPQKK